MSPLRICHVITTLEPAGAQTLLADHLDHLAPERFENTLAWLRGPAVVRPRSAGVHLLDLGWRGGFDARAPFRLAHHLRAERIDLVHTHLVHAGLVGRLASSWAGRIPVVTTRHYAAERKSHRLDYRLEDRGTASSARVIAISDAVRAYLLAERLVAPERIRVIRNGVDLDRFSPERVRAACPRPRGGDTRILGTVGRLEPQKDHELLLEAFAEVHRARPETRLEIAGEGSLRPRLEARAHELEIGAATKFLGAVRPEDMPATLAKWDLFAFPSRWEGFGLALAEAMAMELPVVASDVEGIPELLDQERCGWLAPPGDASAWARTLLEVLAHPEEAAARAALGRGHIAAHFDLRAASAKLALLYEEVAAGQVRTARGRSLE